MFLRIVELLRNLALICQKWSLKLLLLKSGGTRAVQKGAKKNLPLIITNSKAKKKGAHFEHLNYHLLSILIDVYHKLTFRCRKVTYPRKTC